MMNDIKSIKLIDGHWWEVISSGCTSKMLEISSNQAPFVEGILRVDPKTGADYNLDAFRMGKTLQELLSIAQMHGIVDCINVQQTFNFESGWVPSIEQETKKCTCLSRDLLLFGCKCGGV